MSAPAPSMYSPAAKETAAHLGLRLGRANLEEFADVVLALARADRRVVVVTSDNPRTEDPERILDDIEAGMQRRDHLRIEDRRAAIAKALHMATSHDVIVLAGKGHETYQIRGTVSYPFDERVIVDELSGAAA